MTSSNVIHEGQVRIGPNSRAHWKVHSIVGDEVKVTCVLASPIHSACYKGAAERFRMIRFKEWEVVSSERIRKGFAKFVSEVVEKEAA